jgi:broad specificity phosphatase PhoE
MRTAEVVAMGGGFGDVLHLYLVRHGQSLSNVEGRLCAQPPGPGLTERGREQAERAATLLMRQVRAPVHVVTSPLLRAWQTADAFTRRLGGRAPAVLPELRETAFGPWEGRTHAELHALAAYRAWTADPVGTTPPGVEGVLEAGGRALRALTALAASLPPASSLVAFSHQHVLWGFVLLCGVPAAEAWFPNAVVVHARWRGKEGGWQVLSIDRTATDGGVWRAGDALRQA